MQKEHKKLPPTESRVYDTNQDSIYGDNSNLDSIYSDLWW